MQTRLREEIDGDLTENYVGISDFRTNQNRYEINCGQCCKTLYADKETAQSIYSSIEQGLDNPFLCSDCQQEIEEAAYEDR